ncbi:MAG: hypothetical protein KatS3mg004_1348 [Bryobacteraceae bacterium]|nr:MAG: hypothetical protein KatS3mg004_1348 [Bryobacteraceae bacterium]
MPYCANCGSPVEGAFCPNCGRPVGQATGGAYPPPAGGAPQGQYYQQGGYPPPAAAGLTENVAGALCYLAGLITGIIFLVVAPYNTNRTVRFHAFQSIFFSIAWIAIWIVEMIVSAVLTGIPVLGWMLSMLLWAAIALGGFILWLLLMWKAYQGDRLMLPVIGPLAEKQAAG